MSLKWNFTGKYSFKNDNFSKIYGFYVIETPVSHVSARGISFKDRGINLKSLNAALKRATPFLKHEWYDVTVKACENCVRDKGILDKSDLSHEIVIHTINESHCAGKTDSLFYAIRCAFAHGSFCIHKRNGTTYYMLENRDKGVLKARMILKEETLILWIDVVKSKPTPKNKRT